jgi:DNA-binding PucR family transcriptional regulator
MCARGQGNVESQAASIHAWLALRNLRALTAPWEGVVAVILLDPPPLAATRELANLFCAGKWSPTAVPLQLGISRRTGLRGLPVALREAEQALSLADFHSTPHGLFYQDLGALRVLLGLRDDFDLEAFCEDELGAVLAYDRAHEWGLVQTLRALFETGDRSHAANRLKVHRQTLYYRIRRLETLLGEDFLAPERRLALELALLALDLLGEGNQ